MHADAGGAEDAGSTTDPDAGVVGDAGLNVDAGQLVTVSHVRELRAVWIATAANINFPSSRSLSADQMRAELVSMLEDAAAINLNAVVFQVRPEGDAFYRSTLEPWSRFLTGTQGGDPGFDPLDFLIEEAHARNLEVHAWLNPYRAKTSATTTAVEPHVSLAFPEYAYPYGTGVWMDPAAPGVRAHTVAVIRDVTARYDVDGIHFDDYFYPYPDGTPFPDDATYDAYLQGGGALERGDWRRENVHLLVQAVSEAIAAEKPWVRFGISPFGIYRPGMPPGINGLDQYASIYSDPLRWMNEGWVDYLAPQLYWPTTQTAQAYSALIEWWADQAVDGRYIFSGNFLERLGEPSWDLAEFEAQLMLNRQALPEGGAGEIFFHIRPIQQDRDGIRDLLRSSFYPRPALTPPLAAASGPPPVPPELEIAGGNVMIDHPMRSSLRGWVVYSDAGGGFQISAIHPAATSVLDLGPGRHAVTAVDRFGLESMGSLVEE